jgi:hypothetical protein
VKVITTAAVSHWLGGTIPMPRARPLICEVLTRRLGRPITPAAAGWRAASGIASMIWVTSRLERIGAAARSEVVLKVIAFPLAFAGNLCRFEHTSPCAGEQ